MAQQQQTQVVVQTLGLPTHVKPGSMRHTALQPSPFTALPSSQFSPPTTWPSPHTMEQALGSPLHV